MSKKQSGFTLIELIIFITVLGFISISAFVTFDNILRLNGNPAQALKAAALASSRMEIILFDRQKSGYVDFSDPCNGITTGICEALISYATSNGLTIESPIDISETAPNKTITINVTSSNANTYPLVTRVSNYE